MTTPVLEILPRDERSPAEIELLGKFSILIAEFVNFGTHVLKWELETARGGDENIPISMLFRHLLELGDSISILVKNSSIDPCKLQLRGILEALLGLEYILETDTQNRAMGFMVWHCHKKLNTYKKLDPNDQSHKEFAQKIQKDQSSEAGFSLPLISDLNTHITNLESLLATPAYSSAESEFKKLKKRLSESKSSKKISWYQLFDGPNSLEQLANYLNRQAFYEILYRKWSGPTHGTDVFDGKLFLSKSGKGNVAISQLRSVKDTQEVVQYTLSFLLLAFNMLIEKRIPAHKADLSNWYLTVQKSYMEITTQKNLIKIK